MAPRSASKSTAQAQHLPGGTPHIVDKTVHPASAKQAHLTRKGLHVATHGGHLRAQGTEIIPVFSHISRKLFSFVYRKMGKRFGKSKRKAGLWTRKNRFPNEKTGF
jgi:hypothetical protein